MHLNLTDNASKYEPRQNYGQLQDTSDYCLRYRRTSKRINLHIFDKLFYNFGIRQNWYVLHHGLFKDHTSKLKSDSIALKTQQSDRGHSVNQDKVGLRFFCRNIFQITNTTFMQNCMIQIDFFSKNAQDYRGHDQWCKNIYGQLYGFSIQTLIIGRNYYQLVCNFLMVLIEIVRSFPVMSACTSSISFCFPESSY